MAKNKQTFTIDANLDISQFLSNYKKMIETMKKQGGDQNALASMEKTFDNLAKRANTLEAASKQTFSNSKEIERYQQKVEGLKKDILTAGTAMQTFASNSANFDSKELENAQKELQKIIKQINDVKKTQQTQVASGLNDLGFKNAKDLAKQIDSQEELNKALEKEYDIRSQTKRNLQQERNAKIASVNQKYVDSSVVKTSDFKAGTDKAGNADALNTDIQIMMSLGANTKQIMEQLEDDHEDILEDLKQQVDLEQRLNVLLQERDVLVESTRTNYDNRINAVEDAQFRLGNKSSGHFEASDEARRAFQGVDFASDASTIQNLQGQATNQRVSINELTQVQQNLGEQIRQNTEEIRENNSALEDSVNTYTNVTEETREAVEKQEELNASFDNMKDAVKTLLSVGTAISSIKDVITQTYEDVKELDKSFAEIAMVTNYSVEEMWNSYDQYAQMANELGQTTQSVIQASGLFYQQGLETNEALELTEDTMKLATLAGLDFEKATSQMTAALRGFHMEMDEGSRVTDVYSELAAKAAADVEGIAYAMSKTASIASSAGMEFETTSAFLTQMIETTQEAPENIGTAMKTIIARFTELKENVAGTEDSEFEDLSYNKVDEALQSVGVSIKDASGQFRDLDDVFLELSGKWNTLDRNSQRYIATIAAGSRQQSRFIAMMENYDRTVELVETAYDSAGKSSEQFAKYQDTVEYKVTQLKNTWEQMRIGFADSSFFKGAIDGLNGILETINDLSGGKILTLISSFLLLGKKVGSSLISGVQSMASAWVKVGNSIFSKISLGIKGKSIPINISDKKIQARINAIKDRIQEIEDKKIEIEIDGDTTKIKEDIKRIKNELQEGAEIKIDLNTNKAYIQNADGSTVVPDENEQTAYRYLFYDNKSTEFQEKAEQEQNLQKQKEAAEQRASMIGNIFATTLLTTITAITTEQDPGAAFVMIFGTGMSQVLPQLLTSWAENLLKTKAFAALAGTQSGEAFNAGFTAASGGTIWVVTAVVAAVAALTAGVMALNKRADERRLENRLKAAKERADELEEKLSEVKKEFEEIDKSLDDLKDINDEFDKLANKTVKTVEEQERYNELVEKIKEEYAGIVSFYDEENNKMVLNNSLLEQRLTLMEKQRETAAETLALTQNQSIMANTGVQGLVLTDEVANNLGLIGDDASNINYEDINAIINGNAKVVARGSGKGLTDLGKLFFKEVIEFYSGEADIAFGRNIGDKTISTDSIAAMIGGDHLSAETAQKVYDAITNIDATKGDIEAAVEAVTKEWDEYADDSTSIEKAITEERDIIEEGRKKREESINQNKAQLAEMFTAQFKENEEITEIGAALGGQLVSTVAEAYTELGNQLQDIYTSEKFTSSIAEDAVNDLVDYSKSINVEILGSEEKALEDAIGDVQSGYNVGDNYNELKNETKAILEKVGIDSAKKYAEYTNEGALTDEEFAEKLLTDYAQTLNSELQQKMEEIVLKYQETVEKLAIADNMSITDWENQVERLKQQLSDQNLDDDQIQAFMDTIGETVVNEAKEALINADVKGINDLQVNTIKGLGEKFKELDEDIAKNVGVVINKFELSSDELAVLADMNWMGDISEMVNNAQLYIESLKDAGNDTTEATEKFRKIARDLAYAVGNIVTSSLQYEQMLADFMKNYGESGFGIDGFLDGKKQQIKDGTISATTYAENFDSFKDITEIMNKDGEIKIVFDEDNLSNLIVDAVSKNVQITQDQLDNTKRAYDEGFTQDVINFINQTNYDEYMSKDTEERKEILKNFSVAERTVIEDAFTKDITNVIDARKELFNALNEGYETVAQEWQFNQLALQEKINDSLEEEKKLQDDLAEKERQKTEDLKAVEEARKALNEATFGTEFWEASSDGLYNYEKRLDKIADKIEDIQDKLKKSSSYDDAQNNVNDLLNAIDEQSLARAAQNSVINNYLQDNLKTLEQYRQQYGDFYSQNKDGTFNIDFGKLENIKTNDKIRESLEKLIAERNEYINKQDELNKQEQEQIQQFLDLQKEALDNYVSIQEDIASVLEKQAEEEVEQLKEKYESMKEADNDYIDALSEAIAKQRELRDREKQYDDLAQQRKKLSLMQRDTSGANRKETLELQKSIEEQEEDLLDSEIDSIIDNMKELQETQQEQRDALIENKEAIIENTNFLKEASLIQSTFSTQEDYSAWMLEHDPEAADWSPEKTEQMLKTWEEEYADMAAYVALHNTSIDEAMTHTEEEILNKAQTISNGIETQSSDLMTKVDNEVNELITNAAEKLLDANLKLDKTESEIEEINEDLSNTQTNASALQTAFEQYADLVKQKLKELELQAALTPQVMLNPKNKQLGDEGWAAAEVDARTKALGIGRYASTTNNTSTTNNILTPARKSDIATEAKARSEKIGVNQYAYRTDLSLKDEPVWNDDDKLWYKISYEGQSKYTNNTDIAKKYFEKGISIYRMTPMSGQKNKDKWTSYPIRSLQAFAQGGLVNYTGPAWVDGTPNKPEAFLSAEDTARIGEAAKLLAQLPIFSSLSSEVPISSNVGDTSIEIHINVENLSSDYDVDQMIERVKKDIVDVSKPIGSSVILNK